MKLISQRIPNKIEAIMLVSRNMWPEGICLQLVMTILMIAMMSLQYTVTSVIVTVAVASSNVISLSPGRIYRWLV